MKGGEALSGTDLCAGHALSYKWVSGKWLRMRELPGPQLLPSSLCFEREGFGRGPCSLAEFPSLTGPGALTVPLLHKGFLEE